VAAIVCAPATYRGVDVPATKVSWNAPLLNSTPGCQPAANPVCRWSSTMKRTGGIGDVRVSPTGPFTSAS
jgi:hypothetical protein